MISPDEFDDLFNSFRATVYRLEALPAYDVGGDEADAFAGFLDGKALPERSIRTVPWLARIALSTIVDGKQWSRTRVVSDPPTDYERFELADYPCSQAAGERMRIARRAEVGETGPDFWLFDAETPDPFAVVMLYDAAGRWLGADLVRDRDEVAALIATRDRIDAAAVPLNEYLAACRG